MMTNNHNGQSATIIQFPVGGRAGFFPRRDTLSQPAALPVVDTGSWYHDEAIRESDRAKPH